MAVITPTITIGQTPVISIQCIGITYQQFLSSLGTSIYGIDKIYVNANTYQQVSQTINYNRFDSNGNTIVTSLPFPVDSYQYQPTLLIETDKNLIYLNQNTSLSFNLLANANVNLKLVCEIVKISNNLDNRGSAFFDYDNYEKSDFFNNYCNFLIE
jgi:hypothetical protein